MEQKQMCKKLQRQDGFTLVELIVVLVIMGILTTALVPTVTGYVGVAQEKVGASNLHMAEQAALLYLADWETDGKTAAEIRDDLKVKDLVTAGYLSGVDSALAEYTITYTAAAGDNGKYTVTIAEPDKTAEP